MEVDTINNLERINDQRISINNNFYWKEIIPEEIKFLEAYKLRYDRANPKEIFVGENSRVYDAHKAKVLEEIYYRNGELKKLIVNNKNNELLYRYHEYKVYKRILKNNSNYLIPISYWECPEENIPFLKIHLKALNYRGKAYEEKKKALYWLFDNNPNKTISFYSKTLIVDERTIRNWKQEKFKKKYLSKDEIYEIINLQKNGKTAKEISEELDLNYNTVYYHLKRRLN